MFSVVNVQTKTHLLMNASPSWRSIRVFPFHYACLQLTDITYLCVVILDFSLPKYKVKFCEKVFFARLIYFFYDTSSTKTCTCTACIINLNHYFISCCALANLQDRQMDRQVDVESLYCLQLARHGRGDGESIVNAAGSFLVRCHRAFFRVTA